MCTLCLPSLLDLQYNSLTGTIPTSLTKLTSLSSLWLGYNNFNGGIPSGIGALTNLVYLDISQQMGTVPLSGMIPTTIGSLLSLR